MSFQSDSFFFLELTAMNKSFVQSINRLAYNFFTSGNVVANIQFIKFNVDS